MVELIADFEYVDPLKQDGFVKGHIMFLDYRIHKMYTDENIYIDKYAFVLTVIKKAFNNKYKWNDIKIQYKKKVVMMKGQALV